MLDNLYVITENAEDYNYLVNCNSELRDQKLNAENAEDYSCFVNCNSYSRHVVF